MKQRYMVTASIVLAMLVASIDTTILQATMPIIANDLGQFHLYAWTFMVYILASTSLMPIAGRLADLFGRKNLFVFGTLLFMVGSVLCGWSMNMIQLVIFRAVQGLGAGIITPLVQIIAGDLYSVAKRGRIQALFTSMWMISGLVAPVLGAFLVEYASWRWIFYINIPVCLLSLLMFIPYQDVKTTTRPVIDYIGALLFTSGTVSILMITAVEENRLLWVSIGILLLIAFVFHERRHVAPMIPGSMFKNPIVLWMLVNSFLVCISIFGVSNFIPLYLQDQGYSVLMSGLMLVAISVGWMTLSVKSGPWIIRFGYRPLLLGGNALLLTAAALFVWVIRVPNPVFFLVNLVLLGASFGLIFAVSIIGSQHLVDESNKGISTSMQMFVRNTGLAAGVSIMGVFINQAPSIQEGMRAVSIYSVIGCVIAFLAAWAIRDQVKEGQREKEQGERREDRVLEG